MTWTGTLPTILAGYVPSGDDWSTVLSALGALTETWNEYAPAWTASSANPAIGNGTISAHYIEAGHLLIAKGVIAIGSTTTFGTGYWIHALPVAVTLGNRSLGLANLHDSSTPTNDRAGGVELLSSTTFRFVANGRIDATTPFTWASGDTLQWLFLGEGA